MILAPKDHPRDNPETETPGGIPSFSKSQGSKNQDPKNQYSKNQGGHATKDTLMTPEQQSEIDDQRSMLHQQGLFIFAIPILSTLALSLSQGRPPVVRQAHHERTLQRLERMKRPWLHQTRRATVPALEDLLYLPIPLLDHGFIRPIDYMGDDAAIVQSARVSYGRGTRRISDDRGLIRYLMRHQHTTPLEMCEIKLHCKMPIFVARQWVRHRTANLNEYSARYSILDREFYIPSQEVMAAQSQTNRQGRGQQLSTEQAQQVQELLYQDAMRAYDHYEEMLNEDREGQPRDSSRMGLARELARMNLSLNYYTQWYWKIDLHNLLNFLRLRADPHAQHEIRVYADAILHQLVRPWVPLAYEAFLDYQLNARTFSSQEMVLLKTILGKHQAELEELRPTVKMSQREWEEMLEVLSQED